MLALKAEGKIGHWGVSVGDVEIGREALRCGAEVIELAYNLVNGSDLHRLAGDVMVSGAGVLARSTLAYGLLARHVDEGPRVRRPATTGPTAGRGRSSSGGSSRWRRCSFLVHGRREDDARGRRALRAGEPHRVDGGARAAHGEQLEELVREVGVGPVYLRDEDLARCRARSRTWGST